ncbi:MAG: hypothetical protein ACC652_11065 [Acidimicrobiales bacterium]
MDRDDPFREVAMQSGFLQSSLFTSLGEAYWVSELGIAADSERPRAPHSSLGTSVLTDLSLEGGAVIAVVVAGVLIVAFHALWEAVYVARGAVSNRRRAFDMRT